MIRSGVYYKNKKCILSQLGSPGSKKCDSSAVSRFYGNIALNYMGRLVIFFKWTKLTK